jgi:hypothetical protein
LIVVFGIADFMIPSSENGVGGFGKEKVGFVMFNGCLMIHDNEFFSVEMKMHV